MKSNNRQITTLEHIAFPMLVDCFLEAFANYFVPLPTEHAYYKTRWAAAGVCYDLSYGIFDGDQLIAFIIHAVDERNGEIIAFNTGTGVLPNYRGQQLVQQLYDYALEDLKTKGIRKSKLEVIQENSKAIRAYQKVGFQIHKELLCYKALLRTDPKKQIQFQEYPIGDVNWAALPKQDEYAWDFQKETVCNGGYRFYYVLDNGNYQSFFVLHESNGMLAQFDLLESDEKQWTYLFEAISRVEPNIRIHNLSSHRRDKISLLEKLGFENTINQYEMELVF